MTSTARTIRTAVVHYVTCQLLLSCVVQAQTTGKDRFDPHDTSSEEKAYIIDTFADDGLKQYAQETGCEIEISNNLFTTYRLTPFVELLYANGTKTDEGRVFYDVWNSELVGDQLNTNQDGMIDLSQDPPTIPNFNKRLLMDMNIMCYKTQEDLGDVPLYKSFPFTTSPNVSVKFQFFAPILPGVAGGAYLFDTPNYVYRWNTFLYYPDTTVYTLARYNANGRLEIYVMQAIGNSINNQYTPDQLVLNPVDANTTTTNPLTPSITPPEGVIFGYIRLRQYLLVPSYGQARVVSDNLGNAYQWVNDTTSEWLYSQYQNTVKQAPTDNGDGAHTVVSTSSSSTASSVMVVLSVMVLMRVFQTQG